MGPACSDAAAAPARGENPSQPASHGTRRERGPMGLYYADNNWFPLPFIPAPDCPCPSPLLFPPPPLPPSSSSTRDATPDALSPRLIGSRGAIAPIGTAWRRDAGPRGRRTWPAPAAGDLTAPALSSPANKFRLEKPNREFLKTAWTEVEGLVHAEMHDSPRSGLCASADRRCCLKHIPVFNQRKIKGCRSRMINNTQRQSLSDP